MIPVSPYKAAKCNDTQKFSKNLLFESKHLSFLQDKILKSFCMHPLNSPVLRGILGSSP